MQYGLYCNICGKKMNHGDYGIFDYWGDYEGKRVIGYYCSLKCAIESKERDIELKKTGKIKGW